MNCFVNFHTLLEKQFDKKIKIFQSNSGGEFSGKDFQHLLDHGIMHQVSCPATLEQNSVVERKHHHVIELGLAMMYHAGMPKKYWVEAFGTAIYLIN